MSDNEHEGPPRNAPPPSDVHAKPAAEGGGGSAMDMDGVGVGDYGNLPNCWRPEEDHTHIAQRERSGAKLFSSIFIGKMFNLAICNLTHCSIT